jgi:hypothetical protein
MDVITGIFAIVGGVGVTAVTYRWSFQQGFYLLAFGPVVFGALRLMRGVERWRR